MGQLKTIFCQQPYQQFYCTANLYFTTLLGFLPLNLRVGREVPAAKGRVFRKAEAKELDPTF
jgi:hypothetical protein